MQNLVEKFESFCGVRGLMPLELEADGLAVLSPGIPHQVANLRFYSWWSCLGSVKDRGQAQAVFLLLG